MVTIAPKRTAKTEVLPSTTLLPQRTTAARRSCLLGLLSPRSSFTGYGPKHNVDLPEGMFRHANNSRVRVKGWLRLCKAAANGRCAHGRGGTGPHSRTATRDAVTNGEVADRNAVWTEKSQEGPGADADEEEEDDG